MRGTRSADMVGNIFFNVMKITCFNFVEEQICLERTWYGFCTRSETRRIAQTQETVPYE